MPERNKGDKSDAPALSRLEQLRKARKDERYEPEMPPVDVAGYILGHLFDVGPTMAAGMSSGPVTHEELRAWQSNNGVELKPWEVSFIRRLSFEYLGELRRAEKRDCPSPWQSDGGQGVTDGESQARAVVAHSMRDSVRRLAGL